MNTPITHIGNVPLSDFLQEYWQKRPLVIRSAVPVDALPVGGTDVLELACRDDADSRLIVGAGEAPDLYYGPFEAEEFEDLPDEAWTVLVQEVDRLTPAGAALMDRFRFLPNWRMDDLMVSYAMPGGGVGAHIDQYDVFLIQGEGRRRWEFGTHPVDAPRWRQDSEVAILEQFVPDQTVILEPGDLLYLPPRVAHNGVALEPCITLSVGFRAPSRADLLSGIAALASETFSDADRYSDTSPEGVADTGLLDGAALARLRSMVREALNSDARLDEWIGRIVTDPARGSSAEPPAEEMDLEALIEAMEAGSVMRRGSTSQFAYTLAGGEVTLFVAGQAYACGDAVEEVRSLTGALAIGPEALGRMLARKDLAQTVLRLLNQGELLLETGGAQ